MKRGLIPSEMQAEQVGKEVTDGVRDRDFEVFWYEHRPTRLTLFAVRVIATEQIVQHGAF